MSMVNLKKKLSLFSIIMINVIAVASIRTLPIAAQYGYSLVFYYIIGGIFFLIPSALVSAELGTAWPKTGGLYVWIKEAFGIKIATITIWLNWMYNLVWYPTIMALVAGVSAYLISPELVNNKYYIISIILSLFWISTFSNCYGMRISSWISSIGAIIGTLIPMFIIILLGLFYYYGKNPIAIDLTVTTLIPSGDHYDKIGYFSTVLFSLLGLEMAATHAKEMKDPKKDYPRALFISVIIILLFIIFSALSIAVVVPNKQLNLVIGVIQAFEIFFNSLNIPSLTKVMSLAIILGALGNVNAWIIGPTKGIMVASKDKSLPSFLTRQNKYGAPMYALVCQAIIVTLLSLLYIFMPSVNSTFSLLSIITAQLAMIVYITLFAACITLHYKKSHVKRAFKIPGGNAGIWIASSSGICIALLAFIAGFIPPKEILIINIYTYEALLVGGYDFFIIAPSNFYTIV